MRPAARAPAPCPRPVPWARAPAAERRALRPVRRPSSDRAAGAVAAEPAARTIQIRCRAITQRLRWTQPNTAAAFPPRAPRPRCGYCLKSAAIAFANVPFCSAAEKAGLDANALKFALPDKADKAGAFRAKAASAAGLFASAANADGFALIAANAAGFEFSADVICAFSLPCEASEAAA